MIEVRIGVAESTKEISVEVDGKPEDYVKSVNDALLDTTGLLWITDHKGRRIGVPSARISYVEIDAEKGPRAVGFAGMATPPRQDQES